MMMMESKNIDDQPVTHGDLKRIYRKCIIFLTCVLLLFCVQEFKILPKQILPVYILAFGIGAVWIFYLITRILKNKGKK